MATIPTRIAPSREARQLFNSMHARSLNGHLSIAQSIALAIDRRRDGVQETDHKSIDQLKQEKWIHEAPDGGWDLDR